MGRIFVTGGTGFIGRALCKELVSRGHDVTVLSRNADKLPQVCGERVHGISSFNQLAGVEPFGAVVNLAGEPIFGRRWSPERKQRLRDSRIELTEALVEAMARLAGPPQVLLSGSAIGYYGDQGDRVLDESSDSLGTGFSRRLCEDWEHAALVAAKLGTRVCLLRTGLVLGPGGGLLERMLLSFRAFLGGRLGNGRQWMSWIHLSDHVAAMCRLLDDPSLDGAFNLTAPNPVTNREFTETLAALLHRPAVLHTPAWLLNSLFGEMAELLLGSQRVVPQRLVAAGFQFREPDLEAALRACIGSSSGH